MLAFLEPSPKILCSRHIYIYAVYALKVRFRDWILPGNWLSDSTVAMMLPLKIENFFKWHHLCLYQFLVKGLFFPKEIFYYMQCHPAWPRALFEVLHHIEFSSSSRVVQGEQGHARILLLLLHGHYQSVNWSLSTCEQGLDQLSINCQPNRWSIVSRSALNCKLLWTLKNKAIL